MYWTEIEDDLVKQWQVRQTPKQEYLIYKKLYTKIYFMAVSILNKYFSKRNKNDAHLHATDAINHVFVGLDKFDASRGSSFSFISNVIKNRYANQITHNLFYEKFDFDAVDFEVMPDKTEYENNNDVQRILKHIDKRIEETKAMYWKRINVCKNIEKEGYLRKIIVGRIIKQYFKAHGLYHFSNAGMFDWCFSALPDTYNPWLITRSIKFFIGIAVSNEKYVKRENTNYLSKEKVWVDKLGIINTDHPPNDIKWSAQRRFKNKQKENMHDNIYIFW